MSQLLKGINPFRNRKDKSSKETHSKSKHGSDSSSTEDGPPPYSSANAAPFPANEKQTEPHPATSERTQLARATTFRDIPSTDPYEKLKRFDTIFLVDDSGSMCGSNWSQTAAALAVIVPICTKYDTNGVDIHFLNSEVSGIGIRASDEVMKLFSRVRPGGATPTGYKLGKILDKYVSSYKQKRSIKPLNIICITDGEPTDPTKLHRNIKRCAKELDDLEAPDRQVGVQFFQVGMEIAATEALEVLDNAMVEIHKVRDMVDTVSWKDMNDGQGLTGEGVLKAIMGAIDKKLDRQQHISV